MIYSHGRQILNERRANKQDRTLLKVALVLIVVAFIGIGFCVAYGIQISDAALV